MQTSRERQRAFRERRAALGQKEIRNIWATADEEKVIKSVIKDILKSMRTDGETYQT